MDCENSKKLTKIMTFTAKSLNGEWVVGDLRHFNGDVWIVNENEKVKVDPNSVGWSIGKKDENGTDIFVGDLIKITQIIHTTGQDEPIEVSQTCRVMYSTEMACIVSDWGTDGYIPIHNLLMPGNISVLVTGKVFDETQYYNLQGLVAMV